MLPPDVRRRVAEHIDRLAAAPVPPGVRKLQAADDAYRIRVGDYRVIYTVDDVARTVFISHVRHRGDAYR